MCGRFQLTASPEEIAEHFQLSRLPKYQPSYNITPLYCRVGGQIAKGGESILGLGAVLVQRHQKQSSSDQRPRRNDSRKTVVSSGLS